MAKSSMSKKILREGTLLGCGNPLLDISANVDDIFLKKYDMKPNDAILAEEKHMPLYAELVEKYKADYIAGGSVQNSLRVCQWILQKPKVAIFFGCVGQDDFAKILEEKARENGVDVQYQYTNKAGTGTCGVLITGAHRSLCANLAAANHFTVDHLHRPENQKLIENAEYYYISGFFLTVSPVSIMKVAEHANKQNRPFMLNFSAAFISRVYTEPLMNVLPYTDVLFGNELEVEAFAEIKGWLDDDIREIGKKIVALPKLNPNRPRMVIITQGHNPVLVFQGDKVEEFNVIRIEADEIVDTNGAGDAFVGGFLSQYVQQKPLKVCIDCGNWAAGQIIRRNGCTFGGQPDFIE